MRRKISKQELAPELKQEIEDIKHKIDNLDLSAENVTLDSPDFQATNVKDGMEELFQNVDSGKNNIAAAIVDMNQPASGSDTFSELVQKIRDISSDDTATAGDIILGQTAFARGQKITGTIVRRTGHVNAQSISRSGTALRLRPLAGYYQGDTTNSVQISHPTIGPANIKAGVNFAGSGLIGTLTPEPNYVYNVGMEPILWVSGTTTGANKEWCYLNLYAIRGSYSTFVTDTAINLSEASKIKIRWNNTGMSTSTNKSHLIVSTIKNGNRDDYDARLVKEENFSVVNDELDVSRLSGNFFIRLHATSGETASNSNLSVVQLWIE